MSNDTSSESRSLRAAITDVLLAHWDPHDAARQPGALGAYDIYVEPLAALLLGHAEEEQLMDWLHARETETMCFPSLGKERLRRVAQKLIACK